MNSLPIAFNLNSVDKKCYYEKYFEFIKDSFWKLFCNFLELTFEFHPFKEMNHNKQKKKQKKNKQKNK